MQILTRTIGLKRLKTDEKVIQIYHYGPLDTAAAL